MNFLYTIYYDSVVCNKFLVEPNRGWPIQKERKQYTSRKKAQEAADKLNSLL